MMHVQNIVLQEIKRFLLKEDNYRGEHTAPGIEDSPMHNLKDTYDNDIYTFDAPRLYAHYHDHRDNEAISIIQSARNKPNQPIKIYRAVPDVIKDINLKLKPLLYIINYYNQWGFFPMKDKIIYQLTDKYDIEKYTYDKQKELIINDIMEQIKDLKLKQNKQPTINNGDWVTISKSYAIEHGKSNLDKFKISTKTVPAKHLFTDGNNIFEWGYNQL